LSFSDLVFRSLADDRGGVTVSHEALRTALLCAPSSRKVAPATVSRAVLCLHLTAWIAQTGLLERGLEHAHASALQEEVRQLHQRAHSPKDGSGDSAPEDGREKSRRRLAPAFPKPAPKMPGEQVERLHQQAYSPEDASWRVPLVGYAQEHGGGAACANHGALVIGLRRGEFRRPASVRVVTARRSDDPANGRNNTASGRFLFRVAYMMGPILP
jgi:hypothetical protein